MNNEQLIKCKYCNNKATEIILRIVQPSFPAPACDNCYHERVNIDKWYIDYRSMRGHENINLEMFINDEENNR